MTRPLVYLSGPITGLSFAAGTDWREHARRRLDDFGITGLSPLRGKDYLSGRGEIFDRMAAEEAASQDAALVARDRFDTTRADFMLCNLLDAKQVSIGTMVELGWADAARVPVVLVMEPLGNIHEHAFVRQLAGYRVKRLDDAIDLIVAALAPVPPAFVARAA